MAETLGPGKRPEKENIFVHHRFYGSYHRSENMVVHSLSEAEKCPTCQKQEEARQKQIAALQQQRKRIEKLEHVYLIAWGIVYDRHSTAAIQGEEMDSCHNPDCMKIQAAFAELEAE